MAFFDFQGAVAGAGSGAGLGSFGGGKGALIGGGIGALAGGFGLFGKKRKQRKIDIGAELARIRGLFESQRSQAEASIRRASGQQRGRVANNLAARGILRSPVSENSFQRVREAELAAVGQSNAQIGAAQANAESRLLSQLLGLRFAQEQQADQRRASLFGTLGSISGNLLLANLMKGGGQEQNQQVNFFNDGSDSNLFGGGDILGKNSTSNVSVTPSLEFFARPRKSDPNNMGQFFGGL